MNERIKLIRKMLGKSQLEFGSKIKFSGNAISNFENNMRSLSPQTILAICREFNVNENWLRTGEGEMFNSTVEEVIKELEEKHQLDDLDKKILETYVKLPKDIQTTLKGIIKTFIEEERQTANVGADNIRPQPTTPTATETPPAAAAPPSDTTTAAILARLEKLERENAVKDEEIARLKAAVKKTTELLNDEDIEENLGNIYVA
ncbi:MAG: helix-turn-helix domain-containing protein [Turicibacter sp.]|nr:helix-turn-helix domain-containing protein [Turicibacter sp.]